MFPHVIIFTIRETISNGEKKATAMNLKASNVFFFCVGFLSRTFTIHRKAG